VEKGASLHTPKKKKKKKKKKREKTGTGPINRNTKVRPLDLPERWDKERRIAYHL